ncbi:hypothetical protein B5C34_12975 [Pacificimonas flava]|uniref:Restriction endonuclease type II NotI domain-containing protein n=2 Tax=Pacificimonas TaxID=1960290 RepID=A0A219B8Z8_9SPHN|nr:MULTISPECIES: NotI family restriction endonuclease [Pacificimonas]MBZ6378418.1 hypothetical protein [Pacificimonas aurantium]OWV34279.1 hypothetical protein B5C34_12975 [Pacificimonas flava]
MTVGISEVIFEVLGRRPELNFDPASEGFICPYIKDLCTKRSTVDKSEPYPLCAINTPKYGPIALCPKRFHGADFLGDVMRTAWSERQAGDLHVANEVTMEGFGRVDHVISEISDGEIQRFVSVELQAIDANGTVRPVYDAMRNGYLVDQRPSYGPNWKNVSKRYMNQLISKGYYHHQWGTKIYASIQDKVYEYFRRDAGFLTTDDVDNEQVNIVFMIYSLSEAS